MIRSSRRCVWPFAAATMLAVTALAACETPGQSGRDSELARVRGEKGFAVIGATAERAVFGAHGQRVVVEPPNGYCLDEGSVAVTRSAAFALIADCLSGSEADLAQTAGEGKVVEIALPRVFPGILTVSISSELVSGPGIRALDVFEASLRTDPGLKLLGRGNSLAPGAIVATRRIGGALYVLIEEPSADGASILAPRFWRAFIEINERLVLVTLSSFSDRPIAEDAMMGFLALQMAQLRRANGLRAAEEEDEIAKAMTASLEVVAVQGGLTVVRSTELAATSAETSREADPLRAPVPRQRVASAGARRGASGRAPAPAQAPAAPRRPGQRSG